MKERGSSIVEALAAAALAGIAAAGLAASAALAARTLDLARDRATALALACERIESLRAGPRVDGDDVRVAPDRTSFTRHWTQVDGRGRPAQLTAQVSWGARAVEVVSEAMP